MFQAVVGNQLPQHVIADDVAAELERLRGEQGIGLSEAVNLLVRRGLAQGPDRSAYRPRAVDLGTRMDVSNVAEVLDLLDES